LFDLINNNEESVKVAKQTRAFANFPPDAKLIPTNPIMLDIVADLLPSATPS
jgi:hypothetical protein